MLDQDRGHANRAEQVSGDGRQCERIVHWLVCVIQHHDAGIVDQHIHVRVIGNERLRCHLDAVRVGNVELNGGHTRIGAERLL